MNDAIFSAFNQLCAAVRDIVERRGHCLGAQLKTELRRRSSGTFNEKSLGFFRFADFLRAAEANGLIRIQPTPGGDVQVALASSASSNTGLRTDARFVSSAHSNLTAEYPAPGGMPSWGAGPPSIRIREDLWNAFNHVYDEWVYDRSQNLAMRKSVATRTDRPGDLVAIPSGRDLLLEWIRAFADGLGHEHKSAILQLLEASDAPLNFLSDVRKDRFLHRAWHQFHVQQVSAKIKTWASSNGIELGNIESRRDRVFKPAASRVQLASMIPGGVVSDFRGRGRHETENEPRIYGGETNAQAALTARLGDQLDTVIEELIKLRGLLAITER